MIWTLPGSIFCWIVKSFLMFISLGLYTQRSPLCFDRSTSSLSRTLRLSASLCFIFRQKPLLSWFPPSALRYKTYWLSNPPPDYHLCISTDSKHFHTLYIVINIRLCSRPQKTIFSFLFLFFWVWNWLRHWSVHFETGPVIIVSGRCWDATKATYCLKYFDFAGFRICTFPFLVLIHAAVLVRLAHHKQWT